MATRTVKSDRKKPSQAYGVGDCYLELVRAFPLVPLLSHADLDRAVAMLNQLIDRETLEPDERRYQEALAILIGHYEAVHEPVPQVTPSEMLRHLIDARGLTQAKLAAATGISESTVSEILAGKRPVSTKNRKLFAEYLKADPAVFVESLKPNP